MTSQFLHTFVSVLEGVAIAGDVKQKGSHLRYLPCIAACRRCHMWPTLELDGPASSESCFRSASCGYKRCNVI